MILKEKLKIGTPYCYPITNYYLLHIVLRLYILFRVCHVKLFCNNCLIITLI